MTTHPEPHRRSRTSHPTPLLFALALLTALFAQTGMAGDVIIIGPPPPPVPGTGGGVTPPPIPTPNPIPIPVPIPPLPTLPPDLPVPPPIPDPGDFVPPPIVFEPPSPQDQVLGANVIQTTTRSRPNGTLLASTPVIVLAPREFTIETPIGSFPIQVRSAGPQVNLSPLPIPEPPAFRPPSFFSAPLPAGSGARALGVSGSFSSIADDATAASWNPAGLIQLERPEVSIVYRHTQTDNQHQSSNPDFQVSDQDYESHGVNYLSAAYPVRSQFLNRNLVVSLNYQEAYDFTQYFAARSIDSDQQRFRRTNRAEFTEIQTDRILAQNETIDVEIVSTLTTRSAASLDQSITTRLVSDSTFTQDGFIEAATPAFAIEVTPQFSVGASLNFYRDSPYPGRELRSRTHASYVARSESISRVTQSQETTGSYHSQALIRVPGIEGFVDPFDVELPSVEGEIPAFGDESTEVLRDVVQVDGTYDEVNSFEDLTGLNATLGFLWTPSRFLSLGGAVDLPWTAEATQRRRVRTASTTTDQSGRVVRTDASDTTKEEDVEFSFPLYWSLGLSLRWTPSWYTSVDGGQTRWSQFAFQSEGEPKINPINGAPHHEQPLDDTTFLRVGTEYLWVLKRTEIPFRAGLVWEQRPALDAPDDYYGFSLGSGISIGKDPGRLIIDVTYTYLESDNVQTVVPGEPGLTTNTRQQQLFVSAIWHF